MENKLTKGVFVDMMSPTPNQIENFVNQNKGLKTNDLQKSLQGEYSSLVQPNVDLFERLSWLEELIIQHRAVNNVTNIKFSTIREYIYARTPFYRRDKKTKDIRVIVGKTDEQTMSLEELSENKLFVKRAKRQLVAAMRDEINQNYANYIQQYPNTGEQS